MVLYVSWRLSVLSFTILGPLTMLMSVYSTWASKLFSQFWGLHSTLSETAEQSFSLIRTVRMFGREQFQLGRYNDTALEKKKIGIRDAWMSGGTSLISKYLELALQALVLTYGGISILRGRNDLTIGGLITFQLYWNMLSNSFQSIFSQITSFTKASGAAQRVIHLLQKLPQVDPNEGLEVSEIGDIVLENVFFRYKSRPDNMVLKGVSLKIPKGSVVALVGKSGGGKSTIVSLLCGSYRPTSGTVRVNGIDLEDLKANDYRHKLGIVQQDTELFNKSVEHNITFGVESYTEAELYDAARKANCLTFIQEFEEGFATKVGERGVKISGGQKQRIAIARMLIKKPQFILMDESTSNLDAESEFIVQQAIDDIVNSGSRPTVLLVAHRLSTVMNADYIAVVDEGKIAEIGTHQELIQRNGIYAQLVQRQVAKLENTLEQ
jgi:ATP-binding cassette subfamily B protein